MRDLRIAVVALALACPRLGAQELTPEIDAGIRRRADSIQRVLADLASSARGAYDPYAAEIAADIRRQERNDSLTHWDPVARYRMQVARDSARIREAQHQLILERALRAAEDRARTRRQATVGLLMMGGLLVGGVSAVKYRARLRQRMAQAANWARAHPHHLVLAAYLMGVCAYISIRADKQQIVEHAETAMVLAPLTLVVGPWALLVEGEQMPLFLTYGVFALWRAGRALLAALSTRQGS